MYFEPDTMHTLAGRGRFPDPVDGRLFDVNAWYGRLAKQDRLIAWHVKDADRIIPLPAPGTNPFTQTRARPGFPLNGGIDVVYGGEGAVANGYPVDPDPEVLGYQEQFDRFELASPGWFHAESDSGPGPAAIDPGRSLRWAKVSAKYLLDLRADDDRDDCDDDDHDHHHHITATARRRSLRLLLATAIVTITAAGSAWAHGDPASHYLETDSLYPSFASQPSQQVQLELLGLLQATERRGYPIKVALVAGEEDLVEDLAMLRTPQRLRRASSRRRSASKLAGAGPHRHAVRSRRRRERASGTDGSGPSPPGDAQALVGGTGRARPAERRRTGADGDDGDPAGSLAPAAIRSPLASRRPRCTHRRPRHRPRLRPPRRRRPPMRAAAPAGC